MPAILRSLRGLGQAMGQANRRMVWVRGMATELPRSGWPIRHKAKVQWGNQDAYMHVNNCQYYRWWETAHILYLREIGMMLKGNAKDPEGAIIARNECHFLKPVNFPDEITVSCRATSLGNTSINIEYLLENGANEKCATGSATLVCPTSLKLS
ncbi:hypothetical protein AAMO2058_000642600 [Amorphochlora amoebiformis]